MKKIIVTGATSMIGSSLISSAIECGMTVYAVVRKNTKRLSRLPFSDLIHIVEVELDALDSLEIPEKCDAFYHFAWAHTVKSERNDPSLQIKNIEYTLSAVRAANRAGCTKFIGAGSQAEYGPVNGVIGKDTRFYPMTAYGTAKFAAGLMSRKECDKLGITHIWGRIFSVYGKYDNEGTMIDYAIKSFLKNESAQFSSGLQKWDYLNEKDAGIIFRLLGEKVEESSDFRIAYGKSKPLKDFIMTVAEKMDSVGLCRFAKPEKDNIPFGLEADISDLEKAIGYKPTVSFDDGIEDVIEFHRNVSEVHNG